MNLTQELSFEDFFKFILPKILIIFYFGTLPTRSSEAFAEFMDSALTNQGSWAMLNKFLPTASKIFEEMLDEILK